MRIKNLKYYDDEYKWALGSIEFLPNLNLLVGVSGAGKTRILRSICNLKAIANGVSLNGVQWEVCFLADNDLEYSWSGEFETKESTISIDQSPEDDEQVRITSEKLTCGEDVIIERTHGEIIFNGLKTPKLSPFKSVIELLKQEDIIALVKGSLDKIILADAEGSERYWRLPVSIFKKYENSSLALLRESNLPVPIKLSILYRTLPEDFAKIKVSFVKVETTKDESIPMVLSNLLKEATTVSIKEKEVQDWIENISSGMLKTLMCISELYLSPDSCVILIDEFENSLGVNCLDSVTDLILNNQKTQFIITSHHPYIINSISPDYWRIVTRQGSIVTARSSLEFHIPSSRQKAFIDLINILEDNYEEVEEMEIHA